MHTVEHHIQREIISRLMFADSLRFRDLRPDGMESNVLNYHLGQLQTMGLVERVDNGYRLSVRGVDYVSGLTIANLRLRHQPKLLAIIVILRADGSYLFAERKCQPFLGAWMLPCGKRHFGESIDEHGVREAQEKLGYADVELNRVGCVDIRTRGADGRVVTHVTGWVFVGKVGMDAVTPSGDDRFSYEWMTDVESFRLVPGTCEVVQAIADGLKGFCIEVDEPYLPDTGGL